MNDTESPSMDDASATVLRGDEIAFVICVEANALLAQAHLLCASIRRFGGRYKDARIVAIAPRPNLTLSDAQATALKTLDVTYVAPPLNTSGHPYGTINRIVAGAWAEEHLDEPFLVMLDTDTLFVGEPTFLRAEVGVRPVDMKGSATRGAADPLDQYWGRICGHAGIELEHLPALETTVDRIAIRASYNGGFLVIRRALGVLEKTRRVFWASLDADDRPLSGSGIDIHASTGRVGATASEWWGSSQAALSVAIWSTTQDVRIYDARYNIPAHLTERAGWPLPPGHEPILLHYHYLLEPGRRGQLKAAMEALGCSPDARNWLRRVLPSLPPC